MRQKQIVVIDDQYFVTESLKRLLEKEGYKIYTARNGYEGVKLARIYKPDLIIMDLNMPVMNGEEAIKLIKGNPDTKNIPIIVLTAFGDVENIIKVSKLGITDYVVKPYTQEDLLLRIKKILGEVSEEQVKKRVAKDVPVNKKSLLKSVMGSGIIFKKMSIKEVKPGMVLATEIRLKPNMVLLPAGTILTEQLIEKLRNLNIVTLNIQIDEIKDLKGGKKNE